MSNLDKMPDRRSKRGTAVYIMRRHAEEQTGASPETICKEIFATERFQDYREVVQFYNLLIQNNYVCGLIKYPPRVHRTSDVGGISIRNPEAGRLARKLATMRKTNMTEAILHALQAELKVEGE